MFSRFFVIFFSQDFEELVEEIRQFYFGSDNIDSEQIERYVELLSYANFRLGVEKSVKLHASKSIGKTYYYR